MNINRAQLENFWLWFKSKSPQLRSSYTERSTIEELDQMVGTISPQLDWEVGPYSDGDNYFALSPCLSTSNLQVTKSIVSFAPVIPGWVFLHAKPAKAWVPKWTVFTSSNSTYSVDATNWKYILYAYDDNVFDIDICVDSLPSDETLRKSVVETALVNILGEEVFLSRLAAIEILPFDEMYAKSNNWSSFEFLKLHMNKLESK